MSFIEEARKIPAKIATAFRDLTTDHSDEDVAREWRIQRGEITPDDLAGFRSGDEEEISLHLMNTSSCFQLSRDPLSPPLISYLGIQTYLDAKRKRSIMTDDEVKIILANQAEANLIAWGQLKPIRLVKDLTYPFMGRKS